MQKIQDVIIEQYGSVPNAARITGQHVAQLYRYIKYDCVVDSKGVVWRAIGSLSHDQPDVAEWNDLADAFNEVVK